METDLFVHFAEIAGVFVGFGALISVRSAPVSDVHSVVYLQGVLGLGVWVVISALIPIAVSQYGVDDHWLWLSCAVVAIAIWAIFMIVFNRSSDSRQLSRSRQRIDRIFPFVGLPLNVCIAGSMVLIITNLSPGNDVALYVTGLTAAVIFAGYTLLALVMSQQRGSGGDKRQGEP
ncbi:hypothetical protein [Microbacterium rhizosphaerae]|uniref:Uncharacterized protein n=1 Tax=Microbacterium rhizosphaerae TaxID=1678237 RepID=A0ABZ0SLA4_9MICO|nr:hypothetical protein [Microbacterium rhizosphaerae]WPR88608.1 hypothetical protein SM116_12605 [Microbacterium rhizosphaerae]